jgi:hypothetical protein
VHEYTSIDNQFGSDHRPVALTLTIELKPYNYIDPSVFLNTLIPDQGFGEMIFTSFQVSIEKNRFQKVNRRFSYPLFLQPRFISEWLVAKPSGYEKRYTDEAKMFVSKTWTHRQLPKLFTAINSPEVLASKFLTISFAMLETTSYTPDNIAYAVIDLAQLKPTKGTEFMQPQAEDADWDYVLVEPKAKLVSHNVQIGTVSL